MSSPPHERPAFTLVELIIYVGIAAIVIVALMRVMLAIMGTREEMETVSAVQQELRFTMDRLTTTVRSALAVQTGASVFGVSRGTLSLALRDPSRSPTVFSLSGGSVIVREGTGASLPLTSPAIAVDELFFRDLSAPGTAGTVKMRIRALDAMTLETSISLRQ